MERLDTTDAWFYEERKLRKSERNATDAVFTLGNGYMGSRGFFEEEQEGDGRLGGIYLAGVYGQGRLVAWKGKHRELANTANIYHVRITVDGEPVLPRVEQVTKYARRLDMQHGVLERSFVWRGKNGQRVLFRFERFVSLNEKHVTGQRIEITPLNGNPRIVLDPGIAGAVRNLVTDTLLSKPTKPGLKHLAVTRASGQLVATQVSSLPEGVGIVQGQQCKVLMAGESVKARSVKAAGGVGRRYDVELAQGSTLTLTKLVHTYTSRDGREPWEKVEASIARKLDYDALLADHKAAWLEKWRLADIEITGNDDDQRALRFNIFHLIQVCPEHDPRLSIGARGLTGEMHEGAVFWDTEIFKLPFFIFTNPEAAAKLLRFRHKTLPEARKHAKELWFDGAMYAWKSGPDGAEETEMNVGAYYAIHIVADIAYTVRQYWEATGDDVFMQRYGTEILIETARFWASRSHYNPIRKNYNILAVRGPNEYDVIVNNNCYTNVMAVENLRYAVEAINALKKDKKVWEKLTAKLKYEDAEAKNWKKIIKGMEIPYDKGLDLYAEDDMYLHRVPFDMKRGKNSLKRVVDSTLPYEAMAMYQITKQSDVICLMNLLPWKFAEEQRRKAYEFYEPRTVHDSSLSYSPHGVLAARLGMIKEAYRYFQDSAYLDIVDGQLNTQSGLHFANFGGTWQIAVMGFAGLSMDNGRLRLENHLPKAWKGMSFRLCYKGAVLLVSLDHKNLSVQVEERGDGRIELYIGEDLVKL